MGEYSGKLKDAEGNGFSYGTFDKTGLYIYLEVNGFAVPERNRGGGRRHVFIMPLKEDTFVTPVDRQTFFTPIKELFDNISDVIGGLGATWISGIADMVVKFQDIFGTRMFNGTLMTQAWRNANPSDLSLKLDFHFGMLDEWNATKEVLQPLLILKRVSLPSAATVTSTYFAPGPSALSAYKAFGDNIFNSVVNESFKNIRTIVTGQDPTIAAGEVDSTRSRSPYASLDAKKREVEKAQSLIDASVGDASEKANAKSMRGIWAVALIAYNKSNNSSRTLFQSPEMICKESTVTFGNQLDDTLSPIFGSCTLSLSSQNPTRSEDYKMDDVWQGSI